MAHKVLPSRTAGHGTGIDVDHQDPLDMVWVSVDGEGEEIRTFPLAAGGIGGAERAQVLPCFEVVGTVQDNLLMLGLHRNHHPESTVGSLMAKHLGIPEMCRAPVEDRIARVLLPRHARVGGEGERLCLGPLQP
ncbi:hypothetical protein D3C73_1153920 [compost metagenome]